MNEQRQNVVIMTKTCQTLFAQAPPRDHLASDKADVLRLVHQDDIWTRQP